MSRLTAACAAIGSAFWWAAAAHAHGSAGASGTESEAGRTLVVFCCVLAAVLYCAGMARLRGRRERGRREMRLRACAFAAGLLSVVAALLSPLDRWGSELFALHMIQHEILMLVAAPLLVLGRPLPVFLWAFDERARTRIARGTLARPVQSVWRFLVSPWVAWLAHALTLWVWHIPSFFDAVLRDGVLHDLQHATFLVTALLFWAAMIENRRAAQQGAAIVYLFTTTVHTSVLGALITFATRPWYASYLQIPRSWGLTALEDQQLGGLIMWVPGSLIYVGIALALLVQWIRSTEPADPATR
jgi:putative membrane protein